MQAGQTLVMFGVFFCDGGRRNFLVVLLKMAYKGSCLSFHSSMALFCFTFFLNVQFVAIQFSKTLWLMVVFRKSPFTLPLIVLQHVILLWKHRVVGLQFPMAIIVFGVEISSLTYMY